MTETWREMTDRHALEKAEAVTAHRDAGRTQTQAAQRLGIPLGHLNSFLSRNNIPWDVKRQGKPTRILEAEQAKETT